MKNRLLWNVHLYGPSQNIECSLWFQAKQEFGQTRRIRNGRAQKQPKAAMSGVIRKSGSRFSLATPGRGVGLTIAR